MRKEYIKPAIDMAAISSEQTLLVGTNGNNWKARSRLPLKTMISSLKKRKIL